MTNTPRLMHHYSTQLRTLPRLTLTVLTLLLQGAAG